MQIGIVEWETYGLRVGNQAMEVDFEEGQVPLGLTAVEGGEQPPNSHFDQMQGLLADTNVSLAQLLAISIVTNKLVMSLREGRKRAAGESP